MVNLYGYPGLGAVTYSYSQEVRLRQQQSETIQKLASQVQAIRQQTESIAKSVETAAKNEGTYTVQASSDAIRKLDIL